MQGAENKIEKHSFEQYLELEQAADSKSEFWDGIIVAMAGGTPSHNKIANSIGTAIDIELDKKLPLYSIDCEVALKDIYKRVKGLGEREVPNAW